MMMVEVIIVEVRMMVMMVAVMEVMMMVVMMVEVRMLEVMMLAVMVVVMMVVEMMIGMSVMVDGSGDGGDRGGGCGDGCSCVIVVLGMVVMIATGFMCQGYCRGLKLFVSSSGLGHVSAIASLPSVQEIWFLSQC